MCLFLLSQQLKFLFHGCCMKVVKVVFLLCGTREEKSFAGSVIKRMLVFLLFVDVVVVILDIEQSKKYLYHFVAREDDNFLRFLWF